MSVLPIILLVDDDDDDRLMLAEAFAEQAPGCQLAYASSGAECFRYLSQTTQLPALILLDLNLPAMNGFEILHQLRTTPPWKKLPVVILSTTRNQEQINRAYQDGANSFVTKPNKFEDVTHMAELLCNYWLNLVQLPQAKDVREKSYVSFKPTAGPGAEGGLYSDVGAQSHVEEHLSQPLVWRDAQYRRTG